MLLEVEERRVRVTGRFAAGVPVRVFSTWQVMGSRAMAVIVVVEAGVVDEVGAEVGDGSDRTREDGSSCCW